MDGAGVGALRLLPATMTGMAAQISNLSGAIQSRSAIRMARFVALRNEVKAANRAPDEDGPRPARPTQLSLGAPRKVHPAV